MEQDSTNQDSQDFDNSSIAKKIDIIVNTIDSVIDYLNSVKF